MELDACGLISVEASFGIGRRNSDKDDDRVAAPGADGAGDDGDTLARTTRCAVHVIVHPSRARRSSSTRASFMHIEDNNSMVLVVNRCGAAGAAGRLFRVCFTPLMCTDRPSRLA